MYRITKKMYAPLLTTTVFLFALILNSCQSQTAAREKASLLVKKDGYSGLSEFREFSDFPLTQIPELINVIDADEKGPVGFVDEYSSHSPVPYMNNYVGIRAAYAIEYLVSDTTKIKQLKNGVILKIQNNDPVWATLSLSDMKEIKNIYANWWSKNKNKSITELRNDWDLNKLILKSPKFKWN